MTHSQRTQFASTLNTLCFFVRRHVKYNGALPEKDKKFKIKHVQIVEMPPVKIRS